MTPRVCSTCGREVPSAGLEGLCPACLLDQAVDSASGTSDDATGSADSTPAPSRFDAGDRFGPYRIDCLLGRGGMGEVYEAEHLEQGRRVALKILHQRLRRQDDRARFFEEGRLAAAVNHPNCVYVFGTEEVAGIPAIVMELLSGETLKDRVRARGPLTAADAIEAALQIVAGLEAARAAGVLHRDVKPSNCFVDGDGVVKVGDFGLSVSATGPEAGAWSAQPPFAGTPEYASPEQIAGEPLDVRSDIYSVGATMFFLLTGRPPFEGADLRHVLEAVRHEPAPKPERPSPHAIPAPLAALVRRCLAKQPSARPATYQSLKAAFDSLRLGASTPAPVGLRLGAGAFDTLIVLPILVPIIPALVVSGVVRGPFGLAAAVIVLLALYWTVFEGLFGAAYGKRRCGLRVVRLDGAKPGFGRAALRSGMLAFPLLAATLGVEMLEKASTGVVAESAPLLALAVAGFVVGAPAMRARSRVAIHDLFSRTRVVQRRQPEDEVDQPDRTSAPDDTGRCLGPYQLLDVVGATDRGMLLRAWDPQLRRVIWIHELEPGAPRVPDRIRDRATPGRLRWLNGRREPGVAWDAYEAAEGMPLLSPRPPQPWPVVRSWLHDLASELAKDSTGGARAALSLDHVWITLAGRAKLLDFRAPGVGAAAEAKDTDAVGSATGFLEQVARRALGRRMSPLPLSASTALGELSGDNASLETMLRGLDAAGSTPDGVTRQRRGMTLSLSLLAYLFGAAPLGRVAQLMVPTGSLAASDVALLSCFALAIVVATATRGGFWLRAFGIAVVRDDGREVARATAGLRAAVAWSWAPIQVLVGVVGGPALPILLIKIVAVLYAADKPSRGLQDALARTNLVPR